MIQLEINLTDTKNVTNLIAALNPLFEYENEDLEVKVGVSRYNDLMQAVLAVSAINFAKLHNKDVQIKYAYTHQYLQRMNFYSALGLNLSEDFARHQAADRLQEICNLTSKSSMTIVNNILLIIKEKIKIDKNLWGTLSYCFWEIVDNIQLHAESSIGGYTVVQYYPSKHIVEIDLVDAGCGILTSMKKNQQFLTISEATALVLCIQEGITDGDGCGNGLYHTTRFIKANKGDFYIYSGHHMLYIRNGKLSVKSVPFWHGTAIHIEIDTNSPVDLNMIFGNAIPTTVTEANECIKNLW